MYLDPFLFAGYVSNIAVYGIHRNGAHLQLRAVRFEHSDKHLLEILNAVPKMANGYLSCTSYHIENIEYEYQLLC